MSDKVYRIVRMESENIKKLKAVAIEPEGNVIEITGDNDQGKTSLLDSIYWALGGVGAIQDDPIREGADKARIYLDIGPYKITRRMTRTEDGFNPTLIVENEEGAKYSSPQKMLDAILGELTFDPLEFVRKKPKEQFDTLKAFVTGFDFEESAAQRKKIFEERTVVGRRAAELEAQAKGIEVPADTPDELVDEKALVAEMQAAAEHNSTVERHKAAREAVRQNIAAMEQANRDRESQKIELLRQIDFLEERSKETFRNIQAEQVKLINAEPLPEPIDPSTISAKIDAARQTNAFVARKHQRAELDRLAKERQAEVKKLTDAIEVIDKAKADAIAAAKMPVEGIGFGDDVVLLNGHPLEQASGAQQLRASIALTMAANPKLRIMLVRDGALLGTAAMKMIAEMADEHDFQVWIETVESSRPGAIVIEDGRIRGAQPAAEAAE
ncbi:conserved hypothetical protein [Mesorhizobium plurifarium]|uniref:Rad50/SbcC-type AAA domain-containing protein n=1 Tax=Mesorhizobium plurifarium TaxID=69974 RepID=A0A090G7E9_MESPL|nr:conserved hypothetical protein [Mesorhizobium plurifarium]